MLEKLTYPTLVASHIKPFIRSSEEELYDPDNGLLLSQNMDGLFDKGYISFNDDGNIILSDKLNPELRKYLSKYTLDKVFIKEKRKNYLNYHRNLFKEKLGINRK
jgi:predicted restriction endonuclease